MALSEKEKRELYEVVQLAVQPLLVDTAMAILEEVEKINLQFCESLGKIFTDRSGDVMQEVIHAQNAAKESRAKMSIHDLIKAK